MPRPGPSVTSGADLQPGSDSLFPSGFTGGGARPSAGSVGTGEIADGSVSGADLNLSSVATALAARGEFTGTYGPVLPGPSGGDDAATLNAFIAAQGVGARIYAKPGAVYSMSGPLVIYSGQTWNFYGATFNLTGSGANMVQNAAYSAARTVMDVVTTASSATVTSATAAFTSSDVGKTVWVWGADVEGGILRTTISSVTSSTTAVLAATAQQTLTAATASVGPRDSGFRIMGGTWNRGSVAGSGSALHSFMLRRADGWTVRDLAINTSAGKYAIYPGDCSDFTIENIVFNTFADGVHLIGPCYGGLIRNLSGYTNDDTVSITPNDWTPYNDVYGDVEGIVIDTIKPYLSTNTAVKVLGGSASPLTTARRITIRNVYGYASNTDQSMGGLVWIGDDVGQSTTTGGRVDEITVENVAGRCKATEELVLLNGSNIGRVRVSNISAAPPATASALSLVALVWVKNTATVDSLTVEGFALEAQTTTTSARISVQSGSTVKSLRIRDVQMVSGSGAHLCKNDGTIGRALVSDVHGVGSSTSSWLYINGSSGTTTELLMDRVQIGTGTGWKSPVRADSGGTLTTFRFANSSLVSNQFALGEFAGTTAIHVSNVRANSNMVWLTNAASNVTLYVDGSTDFGSGAISSVAGYTLTSKRFGLVCDVSLLTGKNTGDAATNNSNANTGTLGVGPCVYTGTAWKSLVSGNTF
jgi:hypothetical protein